MADYKVTDTELTSIANAIRAKTGGSAQIEFPAEFVSEIGRISGGGGSTNILSGTNTPTASVGEDGAIYLKYGLSEYTALEYLGIGESGGAYIDTGFNFTANSEFELKAQYTAQPNSNSWLFGAYVSNKQTNVGFTDGTIYIQTGGAYKAKAFDTDAHIYKSTHSEFVIDGVVQTGSVPNWANTTTLTAKMFYIGNGSYSNKCRVYHCKIWDNGALVRNLIPVKRDSDDVLGMYDLVNGVFYTNVGTGSFIAGEEIQIDDDTIKSTYLKVNGAWQNLIGSDIDDVNTGE